jgi:hypothetical protein
MYEKLEQARENFIAVRNALNKPKYMVAYRKAHYKPLKFFIEHDKNACIRILINESKEDLI